MSNLILMYHYVQNNSSMKCLKVDAFRKQVRYLKKKYKIMTLSELLRYEGKERTCVLTFDDGLKDSITNILPILEEEGIKGVFFIPAILMQKRIVLNVQKRHLLLSKISTKKFVDEINQELPLELKIKRTPIKDNDYLDDLLTANLKWTLDHLDYEIVNPIITSIFKRYFKNEAKIAEKLYLSKADIKLMSSKGMEIGTHGFLHKPLGGLYYKDQEAEISKSVGILKKIIGGKPLYMSYPSGSYNPLTIKLLEKYKFAGAVTINKHLNKTPFNKFELGRYDCIDLKALIN